MSTNTTSNSTKPATEQPDFHFVQGLKARSPTTPAERTLLNNLNAISRHNGVVIHFLIRLCQEVKDEHHRPVFAPMPHMMDLKPAYNLTKRRGWIRDTCGLSSNEELALAYMEGVAEQTSLFSQWVLELRGMYEEKEKRKEKGKKNKKEKEKGNDKGKENENEKRQAAEEELKELQEDREAMDCRMTKLEEILETFQEKEDEEKAGRKCKGKEAREMELPFRPSKPDNARALESLEK